MEHRSIPWKAEWKASGIDPGPLTPEEEALVPVLQAENQEFLKMHPRVSVPKPRLQITAWSMPLAAAAAVLLAISLPFSTVNPAQGSERIKGAGDAVLSVYRQGPSGPEKLSAGSTVRPGEMLQAAYGVSKPLQGALVSVDGSRNVTVHLAKNGRSAPLLTGGEHPLDFSYELDQAPRFEVFFLVVSEHQFDLEPIRQVLKTAVLDSLKPNVFGPEITFTSLALNKGSKP